MTMTFRHDREVIAKVCAARWTTTAQLLGRTHGVSTLAIRAIWNRYPHLIPPAPVAVESAPQARQPRCRVTESHGIIPYSVQMADGATVSLARVQWLGEVRHEQ